MMEVKVYYNDPFLDANRVLAVVHEAFQERLQQGIHFSCSDLTLERMEQGIKDCYLAIAEEDGEIIGYARLKITSRASHFGPIAVSSKRKNKGVGSLLFKKLDEVAKKNNLAYMESDTAFGAKSSVKFHLKNGFKIVGVESYKSTNYYSWRFRKVYNNSIWKYSWYCKVRTIMSWIKCRMLKKADGSRTNIGKLIQRIR